AGQDQHRPVFGHGGAQVEPRRARRLIGGKRYAGGMRKAHDAYGRAYSRGSRHASMLSFGTSATSIQKRVSAGEFGALCTCCIYKRQEEVLHVCRAERWLGQGGWL